MDDDDGILLGILKFISGVFLVGAMILDLVFVYHHWGVGGTIISLVVFPATLLLLPIYAGFSEGYWLPAILTYSPQVGLLAIGGVGTLVSSWFARRGAH